MIEALLVRPFRQEHLKEFEGLRGYHVEWAEAPTPEQLARAEVILGRARVEELEAAKNLRWAQWPAAGTDDCLAHPELFLGRGVMLTNLTGAFSQSISECVLGMVLMLYKKFHLYRDHQAQALWRDEGWQESPVGKHLLILGAGDIGMAVARLFRPFGCRITGMRRVARQVPAEFDAMITADGLDGALPEADIVVCALPGTKETAGLLNRERLARLKPTALLINVGRGSLIDGYALAERLASGQLAGAALDVTDPEPLPPEHPLWRCENALILPHITGGTFGHLRATEERTFAICRENMERYRDGRPLINRVDFATGYRALPGE